jgi:chromate transporter
MRVRARQTRQRFERIASTPTLGGLFLSFVKIGIVGFGGGFAVIAQIRALIVQDRHWMTDQQFVAGFALAQTMPGTPAGNTATYVGLKLRGWRGAAVSLAGFILPSMLIMIVLAILYRHLRYLPAMDYLFHGLNAAVVALVIVAAWRIARPTLIRPWQWLVAVVACLVVAFFGATVLEVVLAAGVVGVFIDSFAEKQLRRLRGFRHFVARRRRRIAARLTLQRQRRRYHQRYFPGVSLTRTLADQRVRLSLRQKTKPSESDAEGQKEFRSSALFLAAVPVFAKLGLLLLLTTMFLRIGAITFGGGFVMIPLIEADVVHNNHWLTHQEFADATALGQITPGPVLIVATFIGYRVAGTLGALVATVSIFFPSFLLTVAAGSSLFRFQTNAVVQSFLKGVTPAVVGLLVAAGISIGRAGIHSWIGILIMIMAGVALMRFRLNGFWVIMSAGLVRVLLSLVWG